DQVTKLSSSQIQFRRLLSNGDEQIYTGTISGPRRTGVLGNVIRGTFRQGGGTYSWSADGDVYDIGNGISTLEIAANGNQGTLKLRLGGGFFVSLILAPQPGVDFDPWQRPDLWEPIDQISFNGATVQFRRPRV